MGSLIPAFSAISASSTEMATGLFSYFGTALIGFAVGVTTAVAVVLLVIKKLTGAINRVAGVRRSRGGRRRR